MIYLYVNNARGWIGLNEDCLWVYRRLDIYQDQVVTVEQSQCWDDLGHLVQACLYVGIIDD